jgi:hypothetical protein
MHLRTSGEWSELKLIGLFLPTTSQEILAELKTIDAALDTKILHIGILGEYNYTISVFGINNNKKYHIISAIVY